MCIRDSDYIVAMDTQNKKDLDNLFAMNPKAKSKMLCIREYDLQASGDLNVPDPYFGGPDGFKTVFDMLDRSCEAFFSEIKKTHNI